MIEEQRVENVRAEIAYLKGETDKHPCGVSGKSRIIPHCESKNCWDTAPKGFRYSAWGNAAGMV